MKLSTARLKALIEENKKDIIRFEKLLAEKKRIKEEYGFEEQNEEVERYEELLKIANEIKNDIESGKIHD